MEYCPLMCWKSLGQCSDDVMRWRELMEMDSVSVLDKVSVVMDCQADSQKIDVRGSSMQRLKETEGRVLAPRYFYQGGGGLF
ncbi:uncharacterized protein LOC144587837 isoform X2 [Pogona vitticeps]